MAGALAAVEVKDFARHKAGRFQAEDRIDDVGDLAQTANRVQRAELRMGLDGMHRRLDDAQRNRIHADSHPSLASPRCIAAALVAVDAVAERCADGTLLALRTGGRL
jgi:hypothetical protein